MVSSCNQLQPQELPRGAIGLQLIAKLLREWSRRAGLNRGPADYESAALPLSYAGRAVAPDGAGASENRSRRADGGQRATGRSRAPTRHRASIRRPCQRPKEAGRSPGATSRRASRLALGLLLTLSLGLNAWGIGWGLPSAAGWAPDELLPSAVLDAMSRGFTGGWHDKYPPLHYYVLATLYLPVLKAAGLSAGMPIPPDVYHRLFLIGRVVSLLMAAGTLWLVYRCGRELGDGAPACSRPAIVALMAPFVFYAKLANLDVPYLFWWALSLLFLLKALTGARLARPAAVRRHGHAGGHHEGPGLRALRR